MSKISNLSLSVVFLQALNAPKLVVGQGSASTPPGELTMLPRTPSQLGRGTPEGNTPPHTYLP